MPFITFNNFPDTFFEWIESEGLADSFQPDPLEFASLPFYAGPHAPEDNGPDNDDNSEWDEDDDSAENVDQRLERSIQSVLAYAATQEGTEPVPTDRIQADHDGIDSDDDSAEDVDQWLERSVQRPLADQEGTEHITTHPVHSDHDSDDNAEDVDDS